MITENLLNQIDSGRSGKNHGYSIGLPKLERIIDGVTPSTYTIIFSPSGVGKTTFALYSYIYKPLCEHMSDNNFKIIYYSLEMSAEILMAKLLCMHIFDTYGVELSLKELLSRRANYTLSDEYYNMIQDSRPWLERVEELLIIYDKGLNAEVLYSSLMKHLTNNGKFTEGENRKIYIPNNPDCVTLVIIDHLSLVRPANGRTLKQEMDLISSYLVTLRNMCKISPLVIMQANREPSSMDRRKEGLNNLTINDSKDTGSPIQDAEVVISIFSPFRERLATYRGYDIKQLGPNFRVISVLKSRYGEADIEDPCAFYGKVGIFKELPKPDEIYDYSKYLTTDWLIHPDEENNDSKFNFNL